MPAPSTNIIDATDATGNHSTELMLNGYVKGLYPGKPNCVVICADGCRYPQYILHLDGNVKDSVYPPFAEGQELLQDLLGHIQTWGKDIHPQVTFKVVPGAKAAYSLRWSCDSTKTLLLLLPDRDSPTWLVMQRGRAPSTTKNVLNHPLPNGRLFEAQQFWGSDPPNISKAAFLILPEVADWPLLFGRGDCAELLAQNSHHEEVNNYLTAVSKQYEREIGENSCWGDLERQCFHRLDASLQQVLRRTLLKQLTDNQLADAWCIEANRQLIEELHPKWAKRRQREDATGEILRRLQIFAVDLEIRGDKLEEIGIIDSLGNCFAWRCGDQPPAAAFLRQVLGRQQEGCLVGHNILVWDRKHLRTELGAEGDLLLDRPLLDTLLVEAILRPRSRKSLELGGNHTALDDARQTVNLLQDQILRLAHLPAEMIAAWTALAGPAMRHLLELVAAHREQLHSVPVADDVDAPPPFLRDLNRQLAELPQHEQHLLLVPRQLLPAVMGLDVLCNAAVLDAGPVDRKTGGRGQVYVEAPDAQWVARLSSDKSPAGYFYGDLLLLLDAFVHAARTAGQLPHIYAMNEWGRNQLCQGDIVSFFSVDHRACAAAAAASPARLTVAPFDSLAEPTFVEFLRHNQYNGVIVFGPELGAGSIIDVHSIRVPLQYSWQTQRIAQGWVMGVDTRDKRDKQDLARWGIDVGEGWRAWIEATGSERADLYCTPTDFLAFVTGLTLGAQPQLRVIPLPTPVAGVTVVHVGRQAQRQAQSESGNRPPDLLSPSSRYRADYLGQVLATVVPRAQAKRVLLALDSPHEESDLLCDLVENVYIPIGTRLRRIEKLRDKKHGLVICHVDDLFEWVIIAQENNIPCPFDEIIVDAWPLDNPRLIPPFTQIELKTLHRAEALAPDTDKEPDALEAVDEEEDEEEDEAEGEAGGCEAGADAEGDQDNEDNEDDEWGEEAVSPREALPTVAQKQLERLRTHPQVLDRVTAAVHLLSGNPLCVLDSRLKLDEQFWEPRYLFKARPLEFALKTAEMIAEQLQQHGLAGAVKVPVPPLDLKQRNEIARSFFNIHCLHDWQQECLDAVMAPDPQPDPIAVTASTGGGKSLVYQLPALFAALYTGRLTLVVAPLLALMQEQCRKLWQAGFVLMVDRLASDMSEAENEDVYHRVADGQVSLLYVAPERFRSRRFLELLDARLRRDGRLQYCVFDEAHCISLWGHSFRPDYLHAAELTAKLRKRYCEDGLAPVLLLTATLPPQVQAHLETIFTPHDQTTAPTNR